MDNKLTFLGRYLPALVVKSEGWSCVQYYEKLSQKRDFPKDGSLTQKTVKNKVKILRKKMKANGGFLLDPLDKTRKLLPSADNEGETYSDSDPEYDSESDDHGEPILQLHIIPNPHLSQEFTRKVDLMSSVFTSLTLSETVKRKGVEEGTALWISEISQYVSMLRSDDGKDAARFIVCALLLNQDTKGHIEGDAEAFLKNSLNIADSDLCLSEALQSKSERKARVLLDAEVERDTELVKKGLSKGKSLPYIQLASMYLNGKGGLRRDQKKARELYQVAAERGNSLAQHKVAYLAETEDTKKRDLHDMLCKKFPELNLGVGCSKDKNGNKQTSVKHLYKIGADNNNADSMNNWALLLEEDGVTFKNCKQVRDLLELGTRLNTSSSCKTSYVKEMICGDMDKVLSLAWELVVANGSEDAGFLAGCPYLLKETKHYNLMLADALLRLSAGKGNVSAEQFLGERMKNLRMKEEGRNYSARIPQDYILNQPEWIAARDRMVEYLTNAFSDLLKVRLAECIMEKS